MGLKVYSLKFNFLTFEIKMLESAAFRLNSKRSESNLNQPLGLQKLLTSKAPTERLVNKERFQSPFLKKKMTELSQTLNTLSKKVGNRRKKRVEFELGALKLRDLVNPYLKAPFETIKKLERKTDPNDALKLTRCTNCGRTGLTLLTTSTQDYLSPRFMQKITSFLPPGKCSDLPLQREVSFEEPSKPEVPKLNFSDLFRRSQNRSRSFSGRSSNEMLKGSPLLNKKASKLAQGLDKLTGVFASRIHRSFDLIFLSRNSEEKSLTFEFSIDDSKDPNMMTGNFGFKDYKEISSIEKKDTCIEDSVLSFSQKDIPGSPKSFSLEKSLSSKQTFEAAVKIMFSRLDKLFYRRKIRSFYCLIEVMY